MHVVFVVRDGYFRFVEGLATEVIRRGGQATFIANDTGKLRRKMSGALASAAVIEAAQSNTATSNSFLPVTRELRSYLHWLALKTQPDFLLQRWLDYLPGWLARLLRLFRRLGIERWLTGGPLRPALAWFEAATTPSRNILEHIRSLKPDLVLITPLIYPDAWEVHYLKACLKLGQKHAALVASWDNLTSKGIFHAQPAVVLVWNDIQVQEAVRYHSLTESTVLAIGAPAFDWLFSAEMALSREKFCHSAGLDPARPYVLYAGSSAINCGDEADIVRKLHACLEELAPARIQLLVRPHPNNLSAWEARPASGFRVAPPLVDVERRVARTNFFNTLYHAAAVVGLNTSVMLEAAVLDRPGLTLLFGDSQDQALKRHGQLPHFQYLLDGAFLEAVEDERACAEKIVEILRDDDRKREARAAFVQSFLRPYGLEMPASVVAVNLFEQLVQKSSLPLAESPQSAWPDVPRARLPA